VTSQTEAVVEVVLWRDHGAAAALPGLPTLTIRLDDEHALGSVVDDVRAQTGLHVALLELTDTNVHLELLGPLDAAAGIDWYDPTVPITGTAPWNQLGWYRSTKAAIDEALRNTVGAGTVGPYRQVKHWSISALIEVGSDAGTFWFKQVPDFMGHESALTSWLSARHPTAVPDVVAAGERWFLSRAFDRPSDEPSLESPHGLLAELQLDTVGCVDELLALGCPDRRLEAMAAELEALADRPRFLDPDLAARLQRALPRVVELVERLQSSPVPASSLVHGDLHAGNWTRRADGSWLIFDWTDGCVGHPFLDLGVLPQEDADRRAAWLDAYLGPWREAYGDAAVSPTLEAALPLAGGFHALSYERIVDGVGAADADSWKPAVTSHLSRLLDAVEG
jgi:hypothetical protein